MLTKGQIDPLLVLAAILLATVHVGEVCSAGGTTWPIKVGSGVAG